MKLLLHPKFKLNGVAFSSEEALKKHSLQLVDKGNNSEASIGKFILEWLNANDFIVAQTSGSTGSPKSITLRKENVYNSALATIDYFKLPEKTKALLCLSSEYIAGKMMLVRAMVAGWDLHSVDAVKNPLQGNKTTFDFAAMVPYQVFHSLRELRKLKKLIIGGGAVPRILEEELQGVKPCVFLTYGMTETISHIAVRPINGRERSDIFSALPSVNFLLTENSCLQISAPKISEAPVITNDVVKLISPQSFKYLGRIDNVINTGGVKVHPESVEEKLSVHLEEPFFISSEKDDALGERVILIVESAKEKLLEEYFHAFEALSKYERPKRVYSVSQFIYTETGKIKRAEVLKDLGIEPR